MTPADPTTPAASLSPSRGDAKFCYRLDFDNVPYGGDDQKLASFAFQAPTSDVVLIDYITVSPDLPPRGSDRRWPAQFRTPPPARAPAHRWRQAGAAALAYPD